MFVQSGVYLPAGYTRQKFQTPSVPVFRYRTEPLKTALLVLPVRPTRPNIDLPGNDLVDEGLLVLIEQCNQLFLGADVLLYPAVHVTEEAGDGGLFGWGRYRNSKLSNNIRVNVWLPSTNALVNQMVSRRDCH